MAEYHDDQPIPNNPNNSQTPEEFLGQQFNAQEISLLDLCQKIQESSYNEAQTQLSRAVRELGYDLHAIDAILEHDGIKNVHDVATETDRAIAELINSEGYDEQVLDQYREINNFSSALARAAFDISDIDNSKKEKIDIQITVLANEDLSDEQKQAIIQGIDVVLPEGESLTELTPEETEALVRVHQEAQKQEHNKAIWKQKAMNHINKNIDKLLPAHYEDIDIIVEAFAEALKQEKFTETSRADVTEQTWQRIDHLLRRMNLDLGSPQVIEFVQDISEDLGENE